MIDSFVYTGLPGRVVFGSGTVSRLAEEATLLEAKRVLVLTTPEQVDQGQRIADILGELSVGIFSGAKMHTPHDVTEDAVEVAQKKFRLTVHRVCRRRRWFLFGWIICFRDRQTQPPGGAGWILPVPTGFAESGCAGYTVRLLGERQDEPHYFGGRRRFHGAGEFAKAGTRCDGN